MSIYTINSSNLLPKAYQILTTANVNAPGKVDIANNNAEAGASGVSSNSESFVQNVLQSLQSLGLNTADLNTTGESTSASSNATEALQVFVKDLYQALQGNPPTTPATDNITLAPTVAENVVPAATVVSADNVLVAETETITPTPIAVIADNAPVAESAAATPTVVSVDAPTTESVASIPTKISGGTNFQYNVDFSQADLGDNLANVESNIKTALENIGQYISSKVVFDLKVLTEDTTPSTLAATNASLMTNAGSEDAVNADTTFVTDSIHGINFYPDAPDATLYINLAKLDEMSFTGLPTPDKYDLTSILTHEILHGLAFTGGLGSDASLKTSYDSLIASEGDANTFVGRHAKTANAGNPVQLSPANAGVGSAYYHVAVPANDLMAASIGKGEVRTISAVDIGMLEDMGVTVTGVLPPQSKAQMAYSNPTTSLKNLTNSLNSDNGQNSALQTDFTNLVDSLGGSTSSSPVNLKDFLTKLSENTSNGNSFQTDSGSLFSASA